MREHLPAVACNEILQLADLLRDLRIRQEMTTALVVQPVQQATFLIIVELEAQAPALLGLSLPFLSFLGLPLSLLLTDLLIYLESFFQPLLFVLVRQGVFRRVLS